MSARRFLWRWNRGVLAREWRQYAVIFVLITVAGAISVGAVIFVFNLTEPPEGEGFGGGKLIASAGHDGALVEQALIAQSHRYAAIDSTGIPVPGSATAVIVKVHDPDNPISAPLFDVTDGRWPLEANEIAVTDRAQGFSAAAIGEEVALADRTFTVVGLAENPTNLGEEFVVVADLDHVAAPAEKRNRVFLIDADPADVTFPAQVQSISTSERGNLLEVRTQVVILLNVVLALAMLEVALLASAGFAAIARRRARQYGLLASAGATAAQVRTASTISGLLVGVPAAVCGSLLGILAALIVVPRQEALVAHRINFTVPWWGIAPTLVLAVAVAGVASRWPVRAMSRQPVVEMLAALRPRPAAIGRSTTVGIVSALLGALAIAVGFSRVDPTVAIVGVILGPIGLLLLSPLLVRFIGRAAGRLPLAARMGARNVARYDKRSGAVVGALGLALAVPAAIAITTTSLDSYNAAKPSNLDPSMAIAWVPGMMATAERTLAVPEVLVDEPVATPSEVEAMAAAIPGSRPVPIQVAVAPYTLSQREDFDVIGPQSAFRPVVAIRPTTEATCGNECNAVGFGEVDDEGGPLISKEFSAWVANPELLEALGVDPALIGPDTTAITNLNEARIYAGFDVANNVDHVYSDGVLHSEQAPGELTVAPMLMSPSFVEAEGLTAVTVGWILVASGEISPLVREAAVEAAGSGVITEFHVAPAPLNRTRLIGLTIGILIGLGIVIAAVSLLSAESSDDLRILTSIGATPRTARLLSASVAAMLTVAGAALALIIGYLALIPQLVNPGTDFPFVVPWMAVAALVLFFPLLAAGLGWLAGGRRHHNLAKAV